MPLQASFQRPGWRSTSGMGLFKVIDNIDTKGRFVRVAAIRPNSTSDCYEPKQEVVFDNYSQVQQCEHENS